MEIAILKKKQRSTNAMWQPLIDDGHRQRHHTHIILKLILSHINLMFPHHRPINSNNNTCAVFLLPCLRKRIDWFHLTTNLSTNIVDILHTLHITVYMLRPVTHFPLSARSDDENYDVRAMFHQCCREPIVRFFIETIVCIIKCVPNAIERNW